MKDNKTYSIESASKFLIDGGAIENDNRTKTGFDTLFSVFERCAENHNDLLGDSKYYWLTDADIQDWRSGQETARPTIKLSQITSEPEKEENAGNGETSEIKFLDSDGTVVEIGDKVKGQGFIVFHDGFKIDRSSVVTVREKDGAIYFGSLSKQSFDKFWLVQKKSKEGQDVVNTPFIYRGYEIYPNLTGFVKYDFHEIGDEKVKGNGKTIEDCKAQIDELINISIVDVLCDESEEKAGEESEDVVYAFKYNPCIHESGYITISLHKTEKGAESAMKSHKAVEATEFNDTYSPENQVKFGLKFGEHESWKVEPIKIQE